MKNLWLRWCEGWNKYWFEPQYLHALALFRFFAGLLLFFYYLRRLPHADELFSTEALHVVSPLFHLLPWDKLIFSTPIAIGIVIFSLIVCLLFAVGFLTRVSNIFLLICILYLDGVDFSVTPGYYGILLISTILMIFAPVGQFGSVDYLLWKRGKSKDEIEERKKGQIWVQKVIVFHLAIIYFSCALHKSMYGEEWYNGQSLWDYFLSDDVGKLPLGIWLAKQNVLLPILGTLTVVVQFFLGLLFVTPQYRYIGIALGFGFHFMTFFVFRIPYLFGLTIYAHYILVADPNHVKLLVDMCEKSLKTKLESFVRLLQEKKKQLSSTVGEQS